MNVRLKAILFLTASIIHGLTARSQDQLQSGQSEIRISDSLRVEKMLISAARFIHSGKNDSARIIILKSQEVADSAGFIIPMARSCELQGELYDSLSTWNEMLYAWLQAVTIYEKAGDKINEGRILGIIASKYFSIGLYEKAALYFSRKFELLPGSDTESKALTSELAADSWYYFPSDSLSVEWYLQSLEYYRSLNDRTGIERCLKRLASLYIRLGNYDSSEKCNLEMLSIFNKPGDAGKQAAIFNNLGFIKFRRKDFSDAVNDFLSAADLAVKNKEANYLLKDIYSNLAVCYQNMGKREEMLNAFNTALDYSKKSESYRDVAAIAHSLALINVSQKDYYHADQYCQDCIEAARKSSSPDIEYECYKTWSEALEKGNDFVKALTCYEKYLSIRDSLNLEQRISEKNEKDRRSIYDASEQSAKLNIADREIQGLALKNLKAESLRRENELKLLLKEKELDRSEKERLNQSLVLEREHTRLLRREQEIRSLEQQKLTDSLSLKLKADEALALEQSNRILETEKKQQELKLEKQKQYKRMAVGIVVLMVIVAASILGGLVNSRRQNRRLAESKRQIEKINLDLEQKNSEILDRNEKISQQKDIIEQKNQSITDSILYASRIQNAVLPPPDFITEMGIENFILYKPKDIISGDFYWGLRKDEKIFIAAADCTGHGVPGALMSMLGHVFLDEILHAGTPANASEMLNSLRDEVINTLKQKGVTGEARDGMDIALCIINTAEKTIDFAGANNPLYLLREGKLIKVVPDRMPIGIHVTTITPFTNQHLSYMEGDRIYIFSDGYADQFGGPKGRKFMYKPFQELLVKIHKLPLDEQKKILEDTFEKWRGDYSQVDDVLVIGMLL